MKALKFSFSPRVSVPLVFFILSVLRLSSQDGKVDNDLGHFYLGTGFSAHNYYYEGTFGFVSEEPSYFSSINLAPTIVFGYENKKIHSSLEMSFYPSMVSSNDTMFDVLYLKKMFSIDYYFLIKKMKFGVLYASHENRHQFGGLAFARKDFVEDGIGFSIGLQHNGFSFDLRKELVFGFGKYVTYIAPIYDHWALRVLKRFNITTKENEQNKKGKRGPFSLSLGLVGTGNPLSNFLESESGVKLYGLIGMEYLIRPWSTSIFFNRSVWYGFQAGQLNFTFHTQVNHLGLSYHASLLKDKSLKIGVQHVWNLDRSLLYFDFLEKGYVYETAPSTYQNFGIGLNFRYPLSPRWDVSLDMDYYYKANERLGKGFNKESMRIGLLYNVW